MRSLPCRAATLSLCALALAAGGPTATPLSAQPSVSDTAQLRRTLAEAFGGELEIVRHELSRGMRERGGTFWLVHARPTRSGDYKLEYRYEYRDHAHPENPLYTHVEHESYVRVGERGCWRRREGKDVCLGDTIILPFVVDDYTGHTFSFTRLDPGGTRPSATSAGLSGAPSDRDTSFLRYLGTRRNEMLHRNGGSTVTHHAELEAVRPGRFNVALRPPPHAGIAAPVLGAGSVPVIVAARGEPVTVLLEHERVVGRDEKNGFMSTRDSQYLTTLLLLQPGDRISLRTWGPRDHVLTRVPTDADAPTVALFPFRLDPAERFNAWIAGHLPRSGAR